MTIVQNIPAFLLLLTSQLSQCKPLHSLLAIAPWSIIVGLRGWTEIFGIESLIVVCRVVGLYIPLDDRGTSEKTFITYIMFMGAYLVWETVCSLAGVLYDDFEDSVYSTGGFLLHFSCILIVGFYFLARRQLEGLLEALEEYGARVSGSGLGGLHHLSRLQETDARRYTAFQRAVWYTIVLINVLYFGSHLLIFNLFGLEKNILPLPDICPFELYYPQLFEFFSFIQFLGNLVPEMQKLGNEFLLMSIMKIQASYFTYLNMAMEEIAMEVKSGDMASVRSNLAKWITLHQEALRITRRYKKMFSPIIMLYYLMMTSFTASGIFYQINATNKTPVQAFSIATYMAMCIIQFFLLCHIGDEVSQEAEKISVSIYSFPWYEMDARVRRDLQLIITMGNKPLTMDAYRIPIMEISKEAFLSYLSAVVSAYMAFNQFGRSSE